MKSSNKQLKDRGYFSKEIESKFVNCNLKKLTELLKSNCAEERTVAASLLSKTKSTKTIVALCKALETETKLYTKIEISKSLASFGLVSLPFLINLLGKIGNNQHKSLPQKEFKKKNYPLPRDISARIIIRIGKKALPALLEVLKLKNTQTNSEAIDAIGFICFYNNNEKILPNLIECYNNNNENELIKWKLIRAMSSFYKSKSFLLEENKIINNIRIKQEIKRSLSLIIDKNEGNENLHKNRR